MYWRHARTARCVASLPGNLVAGGHIRQDLDKFLKDMPELIKVCCDTAGSEAPEAGPSDDAFDELCRRLAAHFNVSDIGPVTNGDCSSPIRAGLLSAWARRVLSDPLLAGVFPSADLVPG